MKLDELNNICDTLYNKKVHNINLDDNKQDITNNNINNNINNNTDNNTNNNTDLGGTSIMDIIKSRQNTDIDVLLDE